jgi:hypothetical protein
MKKTVFLLFSLFFFLETNAQCAMCRAVLESEGSQSTAEAVNDGIVYLMLIPYMLVASIGFLIYWKFFRTKKQNPSEI